MCRIHGCAAMCRAGMLAAVLLALASCVHYDESGLPGSAAAMARDKMMLVRATPPSLGYRRMASLAQAYAPIQQFIEQQGLPDFLAETHKGGHEYLIFYYLVRREAHVCKASHRGAPSAEFSGTYPITDAEFEVLHDFRAGTQVEMFGVNGN